MNCLKGGRRTVTKGGIILVWSRFVVRQWAVQSLQRVITYRLWVNEVRKSGCIESEWGFVWCLCIYVFQTSQREILRWIDRRIVAPAIATRQTVRHLASFRIAFIVPWLRRSRHWQCRVQLHLSCLVVSGGPVFASCIRPGDTPLAALPCYPCQCKLLRQWHRRSVTSDISDFASAVAAAITCTNDNGR